MDSSGQTFKSQIEILRAACEQRQSNICDSVGVHTAGATKDLQTVRGIVDLAEQIESHDRQSVVVKRAQGRDPDHTVTLPRAEPRRDLTDHVQDLRTILSNTTWTKADDQCLRSAVLNDCRRVVAYHLKSRFHHDPIAAVNELTEEQLSRCTVPHHLLVDDVADADDENDLSSRINWEDIASELSMTATAAAKSAVECRTRWLMVQRPELNHTPWSEAELQMLKANVEKYTLSSNSASTSISTPLIDWKAVSTTTGNRRGPIDCITAYQRRLCPSEYDGSHLSQPEPGQEAAYDDAILHMVGVWGFNWPLVGEKLNRHASSVADRYTNALDDRLNIGPWNEKELVELERGIGDMVRQQSAAGSDTPLVLASEGVKIEWNRISQHYVGSRTWRQCRDRWNRIVKDSQKGAQNKSTATDSKGKQVGKLDK